MKEKAENKISLFRNYFNPRPMREISLMQFCNYVKTGWDYSSIIETIRNPQTTDKRRKQLKSQLPAVTISGTFSKRETSKLIKHSGFVCLDIDGKDNLNINNWSELRDDLMRVKNILFSALSVSGRGIFLIIPLEHPNQHCKQFKSLQGEFQRLLDIKIDSSGVDICRLRNISYDQEAKLNFSAVPFTGISNEKQKSFAPPYTFNEDHFSRLIQIIVDSGIDITAKYNDWFSIGCALARELGEAGRAFYHQISQYYTGYSISETDQQFSK